MFAKIVIGVLLVAVLPCESRNQKFVEVPFDDSISAPENQQFTSQSPQVHNPLVGSVLEKPHFANTASNQHFTANQQQFQGNFHGHLVHNQQHISNPIVPTSKPRSVVSGEEVLRNSALRAQLQDASRSSFHGHQDSDFSTFNQVPVSTRHAAAQAPEASLNSFRGVSQSNGFTRSRPVQSNSFGEASPQPTRHSQQFDATIPFGSNTHSDYQLLNSVAQPQKTKQPVNTFLGVEEPTFRFTQHSAEAEKPSEDVSNFALFIRQPQAQPAVRAPVSPPQPRQNFNSHPSQPRQQQISQNSRFPERSELLINAQPEAPAPHRFFVNQAAPVAQEASRRPNSNLALQNQREQELEEQLFRQQAESAKYSFASQIDDSINGNQHQREETRDGNSVKGMYSYSDGYVKRTVFYEADENGYRVVKEEEEPLGNGPQVNPNGQANVSSYVSGNTVQYSITADDIQESRRDIGVEGVQGVQGVQGRHQNLRF